MHSFVYPDDEMSDLHLFSDVFLLTCMHVRDFIVDFLDKQALTTQIDIYNPPL